MNIKYRVIRLVLFTTALLCVIQLPLTARIRNWLEHKVDYVLNSLAIRKKERATSYDSIHYITEKDINNSSFRNTDGYVIKQPGTYVLRGNILWSISAPDSFAITIASNNVTLIGEGNFIKQADSSVQHAIGIQIKEGFTNINVQNMKLEAISGGGIWCRGGNSKLVIKNIKILNCGYHGLTPLDTNGLPENSSTAVTHGILLDGGYGRPIKDAKILDCSFIEQGIFRTTNPSKYERACNAIGVYQASEILIKGCTIDGCIGRDKSWGISLMGISHLLVSDIFITDVYSSGDAQGIYAYDVDGEVQDTTQTAIISNVAESNYEYMLDNHASYSELVKDDPRYQIEANHLKAIIPNHTEHEELLFQEHTWREFRTLSRLVCHNSDKKSKTSAIYGKWVELFCERVLGVKVKVVGAFANAYLSGDIPLPAHRDQYKKWIIGLSFGETRTLEFVPDHPQAKHVSFMMESGDVFIFAPDVNNRYQHRMLAEPERMGRRINVTYFLDILPGQNSAELLKRPVLKDKHIPTFEEAEAYYYAA